MNTDEVNLIAVFEPDGEHADSFVYSTGAPVNLWAAVQLADGETASFQAVAVGLTKLFAGDLVNLGDSTEIKTPTGATLEFKVTGTLPKATVEASQADTEEVNIVTVTDVTGPAA